MSRRASRSLVGLALVSACAPQTADPSGPQAPARARPPGGSVTLTYLGVAGWQIEGAGKTILIDPYFSRPDLAGPLASDPTAVSARAPQRADLILIGHSHVDHLLDAPAVAIATGAELLGSASTTAVGRVKGVAADKLITVQGGEDFDFDGFSVRVIPSLHSALDKKHGIGSAPITVLPPVTFDDYAEGGTFNYLVRLGGREVFVQSSANFIERELAGLAPDIAILAPGLRQEIYDYTCRLVHALGDPAIVLVTHFDNWKGPPVDAPPDADTLAFVTEVQACAPRTRVIVPRHFLRNTL